MSGETAFFIILREKIDFFTPLEKILISSVSKKLKKHIQDSWKDIKPFFGSIRSFFVICDCLKDAKKNYFSQKNF
jgi:hypothetical protein